MLFASSREALRGRLSTLSTHLPSTENITMSQGPTRDQGQLGRTNSSSADNVLRTDVNATIDNANDWALGTQNVELTLPPSPYYGERHLLGAATGKVVTVKGGAKPILGGDFSIADGETTAVIYQQENLWVRECCPGITLVRNLFTRVTENKSVAADDGFVDLLSIPLTVTRPDKPNHKLVISSTFSFQHSPPNEGGSLTHFRLVVNDGTSDTVLDETTDATDSDISFTSGALNGELPSTPYLNLAPGTYTVKLQWATSEDSASISPIESEGSTSATLRVQEYA
jgi:hypothetical protein